MMSRALTVSALTLLNSAWTTSSRQSSEPRASTYPNSPALTAAAAVALITTNVGGIPEVFGPQSSRLIAPGDAAALAQAISSALADGAAMRNEALTLRARVRSEFSAAVMADGVLAAYREALAQHGP